MASLNQIISIYPVLRTLAHHVSTKDLLNLALTCKSNDTHIRSSQSFVDALKRHCICDGRGLAERQAMTGFYSLEKKHRLLFKAANRPLRKDEPVEVRLWNTKCNQDDVLPCSKCGINICEECRFYPREKPGRYNSDRRPHLNAQGKSTNVMCLCEECDRIFEEKLRGQFLNELCDCDTYTRWICNQCVKAEHEFTCAYYLHCTKTKGRIVETKSMFDSSLIRDFYCLCGRTVPEEMRPRCTWCKRRHLPESEWGREWEEVGSKIPCFDHDAYF